MQCDRPSAAQVLGVAVDAFVAGLVGAGVRHVCACPGSRSTPLAMALSARAELKLWMHLDERSAAYFGLGLARALGEPVALLATSGTAAANFLPAVVEAFFGRVPLIVLTADRPRELRDRGAPQTIDQLRLYGQHVRWFVDLPEPQQVPTSDMLRFLRASAERAVAASVGEPRGPVHVNWPLREPLVPTLPCPAPSPRPVRIGPGRPTARADDLQRLAQLLGTTRRGLIVCGPQDDSRLAAAVAALAARLDLPILADPLSGVRYGRHDRSRVLDAYDAFLRDAGTVERLAPEVTLRFGAMPTSKPVLQFLQRHADAEHVLVDAHDFRDPAGVVTDLLQCDPATLCEALCGLVAERAGSWAGEWLRVDRAARAAIEAHFERSVELFEGQVFAELGRLLPDAALLFVGNSMPVRDLDTFLGGSDADWRVMANRGANGIDGVVSTALGASAAGAAAGRPGVLVIGDVSFYHDMNGLLAAHQYGLDLLVVLINNDGGGIFSFLPQAETEPAEFDRLFGTPHGLAFSQFVAAYGGSFLRVDDWPSFRAAVCDGLGRRGLRVVEVRTDRARNVTQHRQVWQAVRRALEPTAAAPE